MSGELSWQNRKHIAIGEGAWADGVAGDEGDFQETGREGRRRDLPVLFLHRMGRTLGSDSQGTGKSPQRLSPPIKRALPPLLRAHSPD